MTPEEKLMGLYRLRGYTDGQARAAAKEFIAEVTRDLNLQIDGLQKRLADALARPLPSDYQHLERLNGELLKTLGSAIQYVEHSRISHKRSEETLEIRHDETCFKCVALKTYFAAESQQTERPKCEHEWSGIAETTGMRVCLKCNASDWPHKLLCDDCKKAAAEWECPGSSDQIPERMYHPTHAFCAACDKGRGCAMIGTKIG